MLINDIINLLNEKYPNKKVSEEELTNYVMRLNSSPAVIIEVLDKLCSNGWDLSNECTSSEIDEKYNDIYDTVNALLKQLDDVIHLNNISKDRNEINNYTESHWLDLARDKIVDLEKFIDHYMLGNNNDVYSNSPTAPINIKKPDNLDEIKIGKLAQYLVRKVFAEKEIPHDILEKMQTFEYSKEVFDLGYPLLALSRDAYRRGGPTYRYYIKPLVYKGITFYLNSQWYKGARQQLWDWYNTCMAEYDPLV